MEERYERVVGPPGTGAGYLKLKEDIVIETVIKTLGLFEPRCSLIKEYIEKLPSEERSVFMQRLRECNKDLYAFLTGGVYQVYQKDERVIVNSTT